MIMLLKLTVRFFYANIIVKYVYVSFNHSSLFFVYETHRPVHRGTCIIILSEKHVIEFQNPMGVKLLSHGPNGNVTLHYIKRSIYQSDIYFLPSD